MSFSGLKAAVVALGVSLVVAAGLSDAAGSPPDATSARAADELTTPCIDAAIAADYEHWLCVGDVLSYQDSTQSKWVRQRIKSGSTSTAPSQRSGTGEYYDTWCENGSICRRNVTDYIHETKGNAAYGDSDGVIGTFDQILKVNLNGRSQRLQGIWYWDSGPAVEFTGMRIQCREEQFGPNPNCGSYAPDNNQNGAFTVSRSDVKDTGRVINGEPVEDDGEYYAEITGYFNPAGDFPRTPLAGLKSSLWQCSRNWSPDCKFP